MRFRRSILAVFLVLLTFLLLSGGSLAIPAISCQYCSCTIYQRNFSTIPGTPQLGIRFNPFSQYMLASARSYDSTSVGAPRMVQMPDIPRTEPRSQRQKGDSR